MEGGETVSEGSGESIPIENPEVELTGESVTEAVDEIAEESETKHEDVE